MCRLAAFPVGTKPGHAMSIMNDMCGRNEDGTGCASIIKGQPKIRKWPLSLAEVRKHKLPLFAEMPHSGWTIGHVRAKTHGDIAVKNTHPFVHGDWTVCHNGVWYEYAIAKQLLRKTYKFEGETDSEVAAAAIAELGPVDFYDTIRECSGVYLALNKNGELWLIKRGGHVEMHKFPDGRVLIASDIRRPFDFTTMDDGWYKYGVDGKLMESSAPVKKESWTPSPHWAGQNPELDDLTDLMTEEIDAYPYNSHHHDRRGHPKSGRFTESDYNKEKKRCESYPTIEDYKKGWRLEDGILKRYPALDETLDLPDKSKIDCEHGAIKELCWTCHPPAIRGSSSSRPVKLSSWPRHNQIVAGVKICDHGFPLKDCMQCKAKPSHCSHRNEVGNCTFCAMEEHVKSEILSETPSNDQMRLFAELPDPSVKERDIKVPTLDQLESWFNKDTK